MKKYYQWLAYEGWGRSVGPPDYKYYNKQLSKHMAKQIYFFAATNLEPAPEIVHFYSSSKRLNGST